MSDETAEKRFEPTPARRDRARREGNAARSQELCGSVSFGAALIGLVASLPLLAGAAAAALRSSTAAARVLDLPHAAVVVGIALVPALCAAIGATAATFAQSGGLHVKPPVLAFAKLAPGPGLKRMFGMEAAVGAVRALVAFAAVTCAVTPIAMHAVAAASSAASLEATAGIVRDALVWACGAALLAGGLFAAADYVVVRRRWLASLKMTFDELKRDAKEQDGDPQAKSRRKQLHRTLVGGGIGRTRDASFVIVNPTHIAVAVRYAPPAVAVPEILVRAMDERAREVRALAERAGIPVVEDVPLARLLWASGEAGRPIPPESFVAVAMTIATLIRSGVLER